MYKGHSLLFSEQAFMIEKALQLASAGDIVLLAGKGVEAYQIIGEVEYPYNEIEVVESLLGNR